MDPLAELIAWSSECVGDVSMEAFEPRRRASAPDPEIERLTAVERSTHRACELASNAALIVGRTRQRPREIGVFSDEPAPALDTASSLQPGERGDEVRAGEVVRRRKRLAVHVVRRLLGNRRKTVRAALDDTSKRARLSPELSSHHGSIVHE